MADHPRKKRPHEYSPVIGDNGVSVPPGKNAKNAAFLSYLSSLPKVDHDDVQALEVRFQEYLDFCAENDFKIGNMVAYLALGISKDDVYNWESGKSRGKEHCEFIKKVKQICAGNRELLMQDGDINNITGLFWQKNHDGFRDQVEHVVAAPNLLGEAADQKTLEERYGAIPLDVYDGSNDSET